MNYLFTASIVRAVSMEGLRALVAASVDFISMSFKLRALSIAYFKDIV